MPAIIPAAVSTSRRPVDPAAVSALLLAPDRWTVTHVAVTGSTNADLASAVAAPHGLVLTTEEQLTGRGRSGRDWSSPAGAGLMFSVLLRLPSVPADRRGWTGALVGLAIVAALRQTGAPPARLKWPNDVLIGGRKCAGILGEVADDALVVGAGINVSLLAGELPRADATSLWLAGDAAAVDSLDGRGPDDGDFTSGDGLAQSAQGEGASVGDRSSSDAAGAVLDREALLAAILDELGGLLDRWTGAHGDVDESGLRSDYLVACATVGSRVRLLLPGGGQRVGTAMDVASDGSLLVRDDAGGERRDAAADVVHLRPDRGTGPGGVRTPDDAGRPGR